MSFLQWLVVSMLLAPAFPAGAGVERPLPGIGVGVSHQQVPVPPETSDEEEEEVMEEEPDCD